MDNLVSFKVGVRVVSSFVFDKVFVNGEWVVVSSGKIFEGIYVEVLDICICGLVFIKYFIYIYVYLFMYVV